jgi:NADH-quinone oxidoreductase subunit N
MTHILLLSPEIVLSAMALLLLVCDLFIVNKRILYHLAWISCVIVSVLVVGLGSLTGHFQGIGSLWIVDPLSQFFKMLVLVTTVLCILLGLDYSSLPERHAGIFSSLILMSAVGMMFLVSSIDLILLFLALELVSISSFILTGFERTHVKSNEGAMKYFLFGAFSSAVMAFGISLFYGTTGTTQLMNLSAHLGGGFILMLAIVFILLGFSFKASIVPMHLWVPDAYEGAPTPVTAFLSLAPKIATMGVLLRIFNILLPSSILNFTLLLSVMAGMTMTVGNFTAFYQDNVKRLLAYSSIAQAGYILIGVVCGNVLGTDGVLLYSFIYVAMNLGAFAVAQVVAEQNQDATDPYDLSGFDGLSRRSFGLALVMAFFLLSLAGIPPMAGFFAKFYLFSAAVQSGHMVLAVVGVVNSVASVYFYMRIVYHMFFKDAKTQAPVHIGPYVYSGLAVALVAVIAFGFYPEPLVATVQASSQFIP